MTDINELNFPENLKYTDEHEWAKTEGDIIVVGISDFAQEQLGDVTFVELPDVDDEFEKGDTFGTVESTKAVSDLMMPIGGQVIAINEELGESPGLVNEDPYAAGWMIHVKPKNLADLDDLMSRDVYVELLKGIE